MVLQRDVQEKLEQHRKDRAATKETVDNAVPENQGTGKEVKFTEEELTKIAEIKDLYEGLTRRMGQIHFELKSLETQKTEAENLFEKNRNDEVNLAKTLSDKYGVGTLDIETGVFTKFTPNK